MKKLAVAATTVAISWMVLGGTSGAQQGEANDAGGNDVLRIGEVLFPANMSPFTSLEFAPAYNWALNWDNTINPSPDNLTASQGAVGSWIQSEDGKTTTYTLVEGLKWSDGEPVTAEDVKWTYDVVAPSPLYSFDYSNLQTVEVVDDQTVRIATSKPSPVLTEGQFLFVLPEHVWGKVPVKELSTTYRPTVPTVGTGPFIVTSFEPNKEVVMERNPYFRGPEPAFDEIRFIKYGSADALRNALSAGEIDLIFGDGARSIPTDFNSPVETSKGLSAGFAQLAFNACLPKDCPNAIRNPALTDPEVRLAIAYALDLDQIVDIASEDQGFKTEGQGFIGPFAERWDQPVEPVYEFDQERANQMLEQAGWERGGDGIREKDGIKLELRLLTASERTAYVDAARLIADQANDVGIEFNVETVPESRLFDSYLREVDGKLAPDFDAIISQGLGGPSDPSILLASYGEAGLGAFNVTGWTDPEYDRLMQQQLVELDVAKRADLINRMESIVQEQVPAVTLWYEPSLGAWNGDRVSNVEPAYPRPDGAIVSIWGYAPLAAAQPGSSGVSGGGGDSSWVWIAIAVVLALGAGAVVLIRRNRKDEEKFEV